MWRLAGHATRSHAAQDDDMLARHCSRRYSTKMERQRLSCSTIKHSEDAITRRSVFAFSAGSDVDAGQSARKSSNRHGHKGILLCCVSSSPLIPAFPRARFTHIDVSVLERVMRAKGDIIMQISSLPPISIKTLRGFCFEHFTLRSH